MILWVLQTHAKQHRDYSILFMKPGYAPLNRVRLSTPRKAQQWLQNLALSDHSFD